MSNNMTKFSIGDKVEVYEYIGTISNIIISDVVAYEVKIIEGNDASLIGCTFAFNEKMISIYKEEKYYVICFKGFR